MHKLHMSLHCLRACCLKITLITFRHSITLPGFFCSLQLTLLTDRHFDKLINVLMKTTTKKHLVGAFQSTKMERFVSDLNDSPAVAATLEEEVLGQVEHLAEPVHRHLQYSEI